MKIFKFSILIVVSLLFVGCSNTPKSAVENMYSSMKDGDFHKFSDNTINPIFDKISLNALVKCSVDKSKYSNPNFLVNDCLVEMYKYLDIRKVKIENVSDSEAKVDVRFLLNNKAQIHSLRVVKVENRWVVKDFIKRIVKE